MKGIRVDPGAGARPGPGRPDLGRVRPRDAGVRARDHRRRGLDHRHRRADARRRHRLAATPARPGLRQPAVRRRRHGRRAVPDRERRRERRPVLGAARRRRQLRHRHLVRVPAAPGRPGLAGPGGPPVQRGARCLPGSTGSTSQSAPDEVSAEFGARPRCRTDSGRCSLRRLQRPAEEAEKCCPGTRVRHAARGLIAPTDLLRAAAGLRRRLPFGLLNYWKSSNIDELSDARSTRWSPSWSVRRRCGRW